MKKLLFLSLVFFHSYILFSQTQITRLNPIAVKGHWVTPVKINAKTGFSIVSAPLNGVCYGIISQTLSSRACDVFFFESCGNNPGTQVPLYWIRKADGKYLSHDGFGASWLEKMQENQSYFQKWMVLKTPGTEENTYNFMLPLAPVTYGYFLTIDSENKTRFLNQASVNLQQCSFVLKML